MLNKETYKDLLVDGEKRYLQFIINSSDCKLNYVFLKEDIDSHSVKWVGMNFSVSEKIDIFSYLPPFKGASMFAGLELNRHYSPEELGLKRNYKI